MFTYVENPQLSFHLNARQKTKIKGKHWLYIKIHSWAGDIEVEKRMGFIARKTKKMVKHENGWKKMKRLTVLNAHSEWLMVIEQNG